MSGSPLPPNFPTKLAAWTPGGGWEPIRNQDQYQKQVISGVQRVLVASEENGVDTLRKLLRFYAGPFRLVYMLVTPPEGYEPTKYQVEDLGVGEVDAFLARFQVFLSSDARHHIWIHAKTSGGTLIYDEHDWIYCYGAQDSVLEWLKANQFSDSMPEIPFPHLHNENAANDQVMEDLLLALPWKKVPVSNIG
jgi:hypothetical protein